MKKRLKIALVSLVGIIVLLIFGLGLQAMVGDGTEKYTGLKKEIAAQAIKDVQDTAAGKYTVVDIYPVTDFEALKSWCPGNQEKAKDPDNAAYYMSKVSAVGWFGVLGAPIERYACHYFSE